MDTLELRTRTTTRTRDGGIPLTGPDVERFLSDLGEKGRSPDTLLRYRRSLDRLYEVLPEDKRLRRGSLAQCREKLLEAGFATRTVNLIMSVGNTYAAYMGHREYQLSGVMQPEKKLHPELTRAEYHHLLQVAKLMDRERVFLIVKLFASADMPVQELAKVTVEAAKAGTVTVVSGNVAQSIHLPPCLCREMLSYADRNGIYRGPIFLTKEGVPMSRTYVTSAISDLCGLAKIPREKGNPRALRRLYLANKKAVEDNIALLVEQALDRQLEQEQLTIAWDTETE